MSDLIERQAAIANYQRVCVTVKCSDCPFRIEDGEFTDCRLERFLHELPSAQPRKRGKWVYEKINSYTSRMYCSECGNSAPFICVSDDYYGVHMHGEINKTNFCPNCGAEMDP